VKHTPWAGEGVTLLENAAGQGHTYAIHTLGCFDDMREECEQTAAWTLRAPIPVCQP